MKLNLEKLKDQILEYLAASEFGVFFAEPGGHRAETAAMWDVEHYPDYQTFLEVARKAGVKIVLFSSAKFEASELDELQEQVDEADLERDEQREYQTRLRKFRAYNGSICSLELAFAHDGSFYVYDAQPEWYEEYLELEEEILVNLPDADLDDDEDENLGGYFSRN